MIGSHGVQSVKVCGNSGDRSKGSPRAVRIGGFTLIELMMTVAIVGILVAVALPNYSQHVRTGRRAEAQAYLQTVAAREQQFFVDTRSYVDLAAVGISVPDSVNGAYTLTVTTAAGPPPTFTVTAEPKAGQSADKCGTLSINQASAKTAATVGCW